MKETVKDWATRGLIVSLLGFLSVAYLHPGFVPVFEGDVSQVMSEGTDAATLPYMYGALSDIAVNRPNELFYGALPSRHLNAPQGFALWIPWSERALALFASSFTPLEHISTVYVGLLMLLNALLMYVLGRTFGWPRALALALAIAWAFSPFTRARAQVHAGFAGPYHVPLAMLSLLWIFRGRGVQSLAAGALGLLVVGMAPHYFVITLAFVSPFLIFIAWSVAGKKGGRSLLRLAIAFVPLIFLLGWFYFKPLPADLITSGAAGHPPSGLSENAGPHPFLTRFAARPIDYFTGDLALGWADWNFVRSDLSREVLATVGDSNPHERANGIRWTVWFLVIAALFHWPRGSRRLKIGILAFGVFAFWLSLAPTWPSVSPSYWLYSLVSQIRVPSRAGIYVHFAALLLVGFYVQHLYRSRDFRRYLPWTLLLLVVVELPPYLQQMKITRVRPRLQSLAGANCGAGMYFPYVSGSWGVLDNYYFLQEMRGNSCGIVNHQWPDQGSEKMFRAMGLGPAILNAFNSGRPESVAAVLKVADCAPLSFLVFDPRTAPAAREGLCARLGWQMTEERVCKREGLALIKNPSECL